MRLIKQPSRWSCLAASWAMVLDVNIDNLFEEIGHDGSEILYPGVKEPDCRRSFHPSEFLLPALTRNLGIVQVELNPCWETPYGETDSVNHDEGNHRFLKNWMEQFDGVITGKTPMGLWHAVAWNKIKILDPANCYREEGYMDVHTFWAAVPIKERS